MNRVALSFASDRHAAAGRVPAALSEPSLEQT